jgi:hypothetical protein
MLKFLPNTPPEIEIVNPLDLGSFEDLVRLELNITDNTFVRTVELMLDSQAWTMMYYNSSQGLWVRDINTLDYDLGQHVLRFRATDASGIISIDEAQVLFVDLTPPIILSHADVTYYYGDVGNTIIWNCTDSRPDFYRILNNGTEIESGAWNVNRFTVNIDGLAIGLYNYTLIVTDVAGNIAIDSVFVDVQPSRITGLYDPMSTVIVAVIGGGFVVIIVYTQYRKRRKKDKDWQF